MNTTTAADLRTALEAQTEYLVASFTRFVTNLHSRIDEDFKGEWCRVEYTRHGANYNSIRHCLVEVHAGYKEVSEYFAGSMKMFKRPFYTVTINEERLAKAAKDYAAFTIAEWFNKLMEKVGDLTDVRFSDYSAGDFTLHGKRGEHDVRIYQQRIINVSVKGKWFNQYPARLNVNGKAISAAAYKKLA